MKIQSTKTFGVQQKQRKVFKGKFIVINACFKKLKKKNLNLPLHLKERELQLNYRKIILNYN